MKESATTIALCELLERQGILRGDVNALQLLALQAVIRKERTDDVEREDARIKVQMALAFPSRAKQILDPDLTEEEEIMESVVDDPDDEWSVEDRQDILHQLQTLGYSVS